MNYRYIPRGVCSREINFSISDGIIHDVRFTGGCNGNLKAIAKLVEGMPAEKVADILEGNTCGFKPTSCADQFSKAIRRALEAKETESQDETEADAQNAGSDQSRKSGAAGRKRRLGKRRKES